MNAINMLKQDHEKVAELFRKFEMAGNHAFQQKQKIAERAFEELERHTMLEEEIFYPAVRVANHRGNEMVTEAIDEHAIVTQLISELKAMAPDTAEYEPKFTVLMENVRHHVRDEEDEMLPHAGARISDSELRRLGDQMAERKRVLMKPSFVSGTIHRAKQLVTKAFNALTNDTTPAPKRVRTKKSTTKRPRAKRAGRAKTRAAMRSGHGKKGTVARTVGRAVAKTKHVVKKSARRVGR